VFIRNGDLGVWNGRVAGIRYHACDDSAIGELSVRFLLAEANQG
jgi:hypothetical protein